MILTGTAEVHEVQIARMAEALEDAGRPDPRLEALAMELEALATNDANGEVRRAFMIASRKVRELKEES